MSPSSIHNWLSTGSVLHTSGAGSWGCRVHNVIAVPHLKVAFHNLSPYAPVRTVFPKRIKISKDLLLSFLLVYMHVSMCGYMHMKADVPGCQECHLLMQQVLDFFHGYKCRQDLDHAIELICMASLCSLASHISPHALTPMLTSFRGFDKADELPTENVVETQVCFAEER